MPQQTNSSIRNTCAILCRYLSLNITGARFALAEKLSLLFTAIALSLAVSTLGLISLVFAAIGIAHLLQMFLAAHWAYVIVAGFFAMAAVLLTVFKRRLLLDPIARSISRLIMNPPEK